MTTVPQRGGAQAPTSKSLIGGAGANTQTPDNSNISGQYAQSPATFGFTSGDMFQTVRVQHVITPRKANPNFVGPLSDVEDPKQGTLQMWDYMTQKEQAGPGKISAMQAALYNAGFYDSSYYSGSNRKPVVTGTADQAYMNALHDLALESVRSGGAMTPDEILAQRSAAMSAQGAQGQGAKLTSPEQIKAMVQAVAPQVIGRHAPQAVVDAITSHLHKLQTDAATQGVASGDDVTQAPNSNQAWFTDQLQQLLPNMAKSYSVFQGLSAGQNAIMQPVGQTYHG